MEPGLRLGMEVVVFGLKDQAVFNGRLCVIDSPAPASPPPRRTPDAELDADADGAAPPIEQPEEDPERRWVLRVLPQQALLGVGRDDPLGDQLISPRVDRIFPNTAHGRHRLRAERVANVLALRGCFAEIFGGLADDLVLRIASFLAPSSPERLMVFSGYRGKIYNSVYMHSAVSASWEQPSRMLTPRIDCAAVKVDATRILFAGGVNGHPMQSATEMLKTVQVYDALTNAWSVLPPMPSGVRHGCGGALLDGLVYVVGGSYAAKADADQSAWNDSMEVFDLETTTWQQVAAPSADKVFPAVGAVAGRIVVAGGETATRAAPGAGRKVEAFDPATQK